MRVPSALRQFIDSLITYPDMEFLPVLQVHGFAKQSKQILTGKTSIPALTKYEKIVKRLLNVHISYN